MNSFGEFLYELRKEQGMTQAELAQKLNVTNKAVSKWETGEAMPETALLLPIARIFGVTVDELLAGGRAEQEEQAERGEPPEEKAEHAEGHLFTRGNEDGVPKTRAEKICGMFCAVFMAASVIAYLCVGVFTELWHPCWLIVVLSALACGVIGAVSDACNAQKRRCKLARGENPYTGCACAVLILVCVAAYLVLGTFTGLWHPLWIVVVGGAIADAVIGAVGAIVIKK